MSKWNIDDDDRGYTINVGKIVAKEDNSDATERPENITRTDTDGGTKKNLDTYINNPSSDPIPTSVANAELENPTIYNLTSPGTINTEFSQALSNGTKEFTIRTRGTGNLQFSFTVGTSGTNFIEVPAGSSFTQGNLLLTGRTLYMQVDTTSESVEILEWT